MHSIKFVIQLVVWFGFVYQTQKQRQFFGILCKISFHKNIKLHTCFQILKSIINVYWKPNYHI